MKKIIITSMFLLGILSGFSQKVTSLNEETFKVNVWNFEQNNAWEFEGDKPMIINFYADWCPSCKMIAPNLRYIQNEYGNEIQIYIINIDDNPRLSNLFKVRSIPTLLFIPATGDYKQIVGPRSKKQLEELVSNLLKIKKFK